ncbi:MAG TPA: hypothetical protein EYG73_09065 [Arcobacter sp.]|nr:hypothetical protein [Arcobacter sp.]
MNIIKPILISTLLFSGCVTPNKPSASNNSDQQEAGKGTQFMAALGGAIIGGLGVYLGNKLKTVDKDETEEEKENREKKERKQILAGFLIGGTAGYIVGGKLADMQKRYKGEEEVLISKILTIDEESEDLKNKSNTLSSELNELENQFINLKKIKYEKSANNTRLKKKFISQLTLKKQKTKDLLKNYEDLSSKISNSKLRVNQYEYKNQDKKELLAYVKKLSNDSNKQKNELHSKIALMEKQLQEIG